MKYYAKRVFSIMMSAILVIVFVISAGASAPNELYHGAIVVDENSNAVNLSDIEIRVFSAQPVYEEQTRKFLYYGETYVFSVYTDENGEFSFVKPTESCSVTINLESLPVGYGIGQKVQFIISGVTHHTYVLSEVAEVDVQMEYEQISASFYSNNGKRLNVEHQIEERLVTMETLSIQQIEQMTSYDRTGKIITPNGDFLFSFPIDLSDYSLQTKVEYLCAEGMISEEKKIDMYCDILLGEASNVQVSGNSTMVKEILAYKNQFLEKKQAVADIASTNKIGSTQESLIEKIDQVSQWANTNSSVNWAMLQRVLEDGFCFRVYYDSDNISSIDATNLTELFIQVYDRFVTELGFNAPLPHTQSYYEITYKYDLQDDNAGFTYYPSTSGSSYIEINYPNTDGLNELEHTVAHEFHHAIMATYGMASCQEWVKEGFANMAGVIYAEAVISNVVDQMEGYLQKSYFSIYDERVEEYGTMLYPLYIYENLGGWNTIKQIYNNFSATGNIYAAITNSGSISSYNAAFVGMFSNNYKPSVFYSAMRGGTALDNAVPKSTYNIGSSYIFSTELMAGRYRQVTSTTNVGTLYVTCSVVNGSGSGFYIDKITESGGNIPSIETTAENFTQVTFAQQNFGSSVTKLVLVAVNTNITGTAILCEMSLST